MIPDNVEHDQHEVLEGKLAGVFALGGLLEEKVEGGALEEPIQGDPGHHGGRGLLNAGIEDGREVRDEGRGRSRRSSRAAGRGAPAGDLSAALRRPIEINQPGRHR